MFLPFAFYQGQFLELGDISLNVTDLGIQRGYSVFDFFKMKNLDNPWLDWYMERLFNSSKSIGLEPDITPGQIKELSRELLRKNEVRNGFIKIIFTAGDSEDGYRAISKPTMLILAMNYFTPPPVLYKNGCSLITADYQRDIPEIKTTNYLKSAMLAGRLDKENAIDVLYHSAGQITESSRSNFYVVIDGEVRTPKEQILKGITRRRVLSLSDLPFQITETNVSISDLSRAKEAFISSTIKGIMPVTFIDKNIIGDGKIGPVTQELILRINSF